MKPRTALAVAVLAGATTAPACNFIGISPAAAQAPPCGGHEATHVIPVGESVECVNARILRDGVRWESGIYVRFDGTFQFGARRPTPAPADIPIEVAFHYGDSGAGTLALFETTLLKGQTQVVLAGSINPADLNDFGCHTQVDAKAYNSNLDTPTNRVRLMGPHFTFENCLPVIPTTTTVTTVPDTAPSTSAPGSSSPSSPPTTATGGGSTTVLVQPSSPGATVTLPATGPIGDASGLFIVGLFLAAGTALVVLARRSPAS